MWLFADHGFTSTVAYDPGFDKKDTKHKKIALASDDPKGMWLLIRARVKEDLIEVQKVLRAIHNDDKYSIHIDTDPGADYSFRALVSRDDMKAYVSNRVDAIDYGSHFKEVAEKRSTQGAARHAAMMSVWSAMARLQPYSPYGGGWSGGSGYTTGSTVIGSAPKFKPSTEWVSVDDVRDALAKQPLSEFSDRYIEAMDDSAFELWLEAWKHVATNGNPDEALSVDDVYDLCEVLNDNDDKSKA